MYFTKINGNAFKPDTPALSRRQQGFESPWGRHFLQEVSARQQPGAGHLSIFSLEFRRLRWKVKRLLKNIASLNLVQRLH